MAESKTESETTKTPQADSAAAAPSLPLFYSGPQALSAERHGAKALASDANYSFARETNSVPVTALELPRVMLNYPIVFTAAEPVVPVAILGLRGARNLFVSDDGTWQAGTYIPAYVRRYPFILMESPDKQQYMLCIDEAAPHVGDTGRAFFEDGEPTEVTKKALKFCSTYQGQHVQTLEFTAMLDEYSLLVDNRAAITLASGEKLSMSGFRVIDEEKFTALPDDVFLDWRQRGWIALVYCHLLSLGNWQSMADGLASSEGLGNGS